MPTHSQWVDDVRKEVRRARETFLRHFEMTYVGFPDVPVWMATEVMTLGTLSKMYSGMRRQDRLPLADGWAIDHRVAASWLHALNYIRNVCAHHARLWNRELAIKPVLPARDPAWSMENARIYPILCILRHITRDVPGGDVWGGQISSLIDRAAALPLGLGPMGVPATWATEPRWQSPAPPAAGSTN